MMAQDAHLPGVRQPPREPRAATSCSAAEASVEADASRAEVVAARGLVSKLRGETPLSVAWPASADRGGARQFWGSRLLRSHSPIK